MPNVWKPVPHLALSPDEIQRITETVARLEHPDIAPRVFARTMPDAPHWYTLVRHWDDPALFRDTVEVIQQYGEPVYYKRGRYTSLIANGYRYWTMGASPASTILINVCPHIYSTAYDAVAENYDHVYHKPHHQEGDVWIKDQLPDLKDKRVLDIGCGTGYLFDLFTSLRIGNGAVHGYPFRKPEQYTGIDPSYAMLKQFAGKYGYYTDRTINCSIGHYYRTDNLKYDVILGLWGAGSYITETDLIKIRLIAKEDADFIVTAFKKTNKPHVLGFTEPYVAGGLYNLPPTREIGTHLFYKMTLQDVQD